MSRITAPVVKTPSSRSRVRSAGTLVEALQRGAQHTQRLADVAGWNSRVGVQRGGLHAVHQAGGLRGRDAASEVVLHQAQAGDVVGGVQPEAAVGTART
jgi:hypothetical protein